MKALFISPQFPLPLNVGSKIRIFNLLKIYSKQYDIDLVCFINEKEGGAHIEELKKICCNIYTIPFDISHQVNRYKNKIIRRFIFLLSNLPFSVKLFHSKQMSNFLKTINLEAYHIVHIEKLFLVPNVLTILRHKERRYKLILDLDDYESQKIENQLKTLKISKKKFLIFVQYLKWRRLEKKIIPQFNHCLVCSVKDKETLKKLFAIKNTFVFPNGVDLSVFKPNGCFENSNQILYFGSMSYAPNNDAVIYFYKEILPIINGFNLNTKFIIVGKDPSSEVLKLHDGKNIIVRGEVSDVKTILQECTLVVVPLRFGGGTRIKILEAMGMKKAIVSTSIGCEGIEAEPGKDLIIADNPTEFANACIELLRNKLYRNFIGNNGRKNVELKYNWEIIGNRLLGFLADIKKIRH